MFLVSIEFLRLFIECFVDVGLCLCCYIQYSVRCTGIVMAIIMQSGVGICAGRSDGTDTERELMESKNNLAKKFKDSSGTYSHSC